MPFLTEELWHQLPQREGARSIALDRFPAFPPERIDPAAEEQISLLQEIIVAARNIRAEMKLDMKAKLQPQFRVSSDSIRSYIEQNADPIERLANVSQPVFAEEAFDPGKGVIRSTKDFELFIAYGETFDVEAERSRLRKELDRLTKDIASKKSRLEDETFRSRAPEHIVKGLESTLAERRTEFDKLGERLAQLEKI
jgi:valyl-tRNA synthetase